MLSGCLFVVPKVVPKNRKRDPMASDRDADVDYELLKRMLLRPAVRILRIADLYFRQGMGAREIATRTGTTEAAVRKVVQRVRRKLSAFLVTR